MPENNCGALKRPWVNDDLYRLQIPTDPQLAPNGTRVLFTQTQAVEASDRYETTLWTAVVADDTEVHQLTQGSADRGARWSPDGHTVAFLRTDGDEPTQIWTISSEGGEAVRITNRPLGVGQPVWSPSGHQIAFAAPVASATEADNSSRLRPIIGDRLDQRLDGMGHIGDITVQLFVHDLPSGRTRQVTWGNMWAGTPVWSPDGTRLAFSADREPDRDIDPTSSVYVVDLDGDVREQLTAPPAVLTPVDWYGDTLLLTGKSVSGLALERLWTLSMRKDTSGRLVELTSDLDRQVAVGAPGYPGAAPQIVGDVVYFCVNEGGAVHLYKVPVAGGRPQLVVGGDTVVDGFSVGADHLALTRATPTAAGELKVDGRVVCASADGVSDVEIVAPSPRTFESSDGTRIQGWVLRRADDAGPQPLLLDIHGGPHNTFGPTFDAIRPYHQSMAAAGWTVLLLNPRGSDGYGEDFMSAVCGQWGVADQDDFLSAVDALVASGEADPDRLAVTGYSYGGFMTCWLTARTDRFKAAVAGGAVTDLRSMSGTSDDGPYLSLVEFGATPQTGATHLDEHSPMGRVAAVRTPTLLLHGEEDERCPMGQAEQWFSALRQLNVPSRLVRYPEASHLFPIGPRPSQRIDYAQRVADWVEEWTQAPTATATATGIGKQPLATRMKGYESRLASLAEEHLVPGVVVAVLDGDEVHQVCHGTANVNTGSPVTPETLFQIGSNAKLYTASMAMALVDRGVVELDGLVRHYLPELRLPDEAVLNELRVRHLLTHTGGLTGDHFGPFTDWGDDAIEQYVATLAEVDQLHPVGAFHSYCNSGWSLLGRLIEVVTGMPYADALRELIVAPLGVRTPFVRPNDILLHSVAVGHVLQDGRPAVASTYQMLPSHAAAGSVPAASAGDVMAFLRMHLNSGHAPNGAAVLSSDSVKAMQEQQVAVVTPKNGVEGYGLGWRVGSIDGQPWIGHGGGTIGGISALEVLPDEQFALLVLTNAPGGNRLGDVVMKDLFYELAGVTVREDPPALCTARPVDPQPYLGTYRHGTGRAQVSVDQNGSLTLTVIEPLLSPELDGPPTTARLEPVEVPHHFMFDGNLIQFVEPDADGRFQYIALDRLFRRSQATDSTQGNPT